MPFEPGPQDRAEEIMFSLFFGYVATEKPETLSGKQNVYPVEIEGFQFEAVVFGRTDDYYFGPPENRTTVPGKAFFGLFVKGQKHPKKIFGIDIAGNATEHTLTARPHTETGEPDLSRLSDKEIAASAAHQIRTYARPAAHVEHFPNLSKKEKVENTRRLLDEAEAVFEVGGREPTKPLFNTIYTRLVDLNKTMLQVDPIEQWNPAGDLTEPEFHEFDLRRKMLSNAIGILTASGEVRHNLYKITTH